MMGRTWKQVGQRGLVAAVAAGCLGGAAAADLLSGFGGPQGFGELAMLPNDDGSSNQLDLPFQINFFGNLFNTFFVNNNGNVTFINRLGEYTPQAFPVSSQPMIAPWWADVDTRGGVPAGNPGSNAVYISSPNANTAVMTWDNVGYYGAATNKLNSFQLVLRNRSETGAGNFDIDFRYNKLQWTAGAASGGTDGLGGTPAQAGYDDGTGAHYYTLPGSRTADVLDLVNTSNVSSTTPGLWTFAVRNGQTPGSEPSNPLLPVVVDGSYRFSFNVVLHQRIYVDPVVAVGYDFQVNGSSPSFESVVLPNVGDGLFDVLVWDGSQFVLASHNLAAGDVYTFGAGGARRFRVTGIELNANLDPSNTSAFVTGLTFSTAGTVDLTQTPITQSVPEPASAALLLLGLGAVANRARRHRQRV